MKVKLTATRSLRYAGRALEAGDQFEASPRYARILTAIRKAKPQTYRTRRMSAKPPTDPVDVPTPPVAPPVESPAPTGPVDPPVTAPPPAADEE